MSDVFDYDAFISYRHTSEDSYVAMNVQKRLERYRLPRTTKATLSNGKRNITRVFRDQDELPLTSDLSDTIKEILKKSEWLIVICSPQYNESEWCLFELETFIEFHGKDRVLLVLAEGEPETAFPKLLQSEDVSVLKDDGTIEIVKKKTEHLAADARGTTPKEVNKNLDIEIFRLLARLYDVKFDELRQRHKEQKNHRRFLMVTAFAFVFFVFGVVGMALAIYIGAQNERISELAVQIDAKNQSLIATSSQTMAEQAENYLLRDNTTDALITAYNSATVNDGISMVYTAKAQYVMSSALHLYSSGNNYQLNNSFMLSDDIVSYKVSKEMRYTAFLLNDGNLCAVNNQTGELIAFDMHGTTVFDGKYVFSEEDSIYYIDSQGDVYCMDFKTFSCTKLIDEEVFFFDLGVNNGCILCLGEDDYGTSVSIFDSNGQVLTFYKIARLGDDSEIDVMGFNDRCLFLAYGDGTESCRVAVCDLTTGKVSRTQSFANTKITGLYFRDHSAVLLLGSTENSDDKFYRMICYDLSSSTVSVIWERKAYGQLPTHIYVNEMDEESLDIICTQSTVSCVEHLTGEVIYTFETDGTIVSVMGKDKDSIILATSNAGIYSINYRTGEFTNENDKMRINVTDIGFMVAKYDLFLFGRVGDNRLYIYSTVKSEGLEYFDSPEDLNDIKVADDFAFNSQMTDSLTPEMIEEYDLYDKYNILSAYFIDNKNWLICNYIDGTVRIYVVADVDDGTGVIETVVTEISEFMSRDGEILGYFESESGSIFLMSHSVTPISVTEDTISYETSRSGAEMRLGSTAYMLNENGECVAQIDDFMGADSEYIYVFCNNQQFGCGRIPIYSAEEVLEYAGEKVGVM